MGAERCRLRKYLFIPLAALILSSAGCAFQLNTKPDETAGADHVHLRQVGDLISRGDFDGALKASQGVLARNPKTPPGDEALLNMGLISAHYANPKKDYKRALQYFQRLEREFPQSPLAEEARIWTGVLQAFEQAKQVDLEIETRKKGLGK